MKFDNLDELVQSMRDDIEVYEEYMDENQYETFLSNVASTVLEMADELGYNRESQMEISQNQYEAFRGVPYFVYTQMFDKPLLIEDKTQYDQRLMDMVDETVQDYIVYQKMLENQGVPLHGMSFSEWYVMPEPIKPHFEDTEDWYNG